MSQPAMPSRRRTALRQLWPVGLALAALLLLIGYALLQGGVLGRDRLWERIQTDGVWRVGIDASFPPFDGLDAAGQPVGFDVDLARAIAARWGVQVHFEGIGFDGLVDAVFAGRIDAAVSALPYQPERTQEVAFSESYFEAGLMLVLPAAQADTVTLNDLAGRRVAVEWGSEGDVQARLLRRRWPDLAIQPLDTPQAALLAVAEGQADAALVDHISALQFMAADSRVGIAPQVVVSDPYTIVLPRKSPRLQDEVDAALRALKADGTLDALAERWLGSSSE
ncbi:MAG: ABC transporter substrate-binding protein [Anaerolineae bacterium]